MDNGYVNKSSPNFDYIKVTSKLMHYQMMEAQIEKLRIYINLIDDVLTLQTL